MSSENNDLIILPQPESDKIPQYKQTIPVNIYHFYIIDEIGEPQSFLDLINTLKTAEEHDTIIIYLNTPGGSLQTTIQILSAIRQCNGTVVTCLEGEVCSAGTLIFLAGDKHIVNAHCTFMVHNYSSWYGGKGNEVALRVKYLQQYFRTLAFDLYKGFLTDDEIESVIEGKDYWMDSVAVVERLNIRNSIQALDVNEVTSDSLMQLCEQVIADEAKDADIIVTPKKKKKLG